MRSRLLTRLDAEIAQARNPIDAAALKAERACLLARQGHKDLARKVVDDLQQQFAWRPHAAMSAWLSLADGLLDHFGHQGDAARDRVQRAYTLSNSASLAPLHALCAAWLAYLDYVENDMSRMARHVAEALALAAPDHHAARARACLVVADAYHFAGAPDGALPWYQRSRVHATTDGDEAHVSSLMHDQARLRGGRACLAAAFGEPGAEDAVRQALMSAESTAHFDAGAGNAAQPSAMPMLRAQLLTADGRWREALALFDAYHDTARAEGQRRLDPWFLADVAWCRLQLGDAARARAAAGACVEGLLQPCDVDDRAIAQARLAQVLDGLDDAAGAAVQRERAQRDLTAHRAEQARLKALLDEALAGVDRSTA